MIHALAAAGRNTRSVTVQIERFFLAWLLNGIYFLILVVVSPILVFRRITQGKYRRGWREKLTGRLTRQHPEKPCVWFHAVSVGEVLQLQKVLELTEQRFPNFELLLTVTTETGSDVAHSKYPRATIRYFPLDFSWAVWKAINTIRPDLIVLVELELWPNFILTAQQAGIPLLLINGRISEQSFKGYRRLKPLMRRLLICFDQIAVQSETYADRLRQLGAPAERVTVTGNIKFDRIESNRDNPKTNDLRIAFRLGQSDQVFIAGSTQDPEENYALDAWLALRNDFPDLRLIIVPRHKERFDEVAALIQRRGCPLIRRSQPDEATMQPAVCLLDTLGELAACWGLADIAFVGGSLTNRGGQNMIEPAGYGAAVLFGPNTQNFKDVTEALLTRSAARVVSNADELREAVRELLSHPDTASQMGNRARDFVLAQQGATTRTIELIVTSASRNRHPRSVSAP